MRTSARAGANGELSPVVNACAPLVRRCVSDPFAAAMCGQIHRSRSKGGLLKPHIAIIGVGVRISKGRSGSTATAFVGPSCRNKGGLLQSRRWLVGVNALPWDQLAADVGVAAEGSGFRGITFSYNVHSEDRVDEALAEASNAGAKITKPPERTPWGGFSGSFSDPEGHVWKSQRMPRSSHFRSSQRPMEKLFLSDPPP
jgi:hypothetical protein